MKPNLYVKSDNLCAIKFIDQLESRLINNSENILPQSDLDPDIVYSYVCNALPDSNFEVSLSKDDGLKYEVKMGVKLSDLVDILFKR